MRTSKLLSKKNIELFLITTDLQFQHHIVLLLFLHCRFLVKFMYIALILVFVSCRVLFFQAELRLPPIYKLISFFQQH